MSKLLKSKILLGVLVVAVMAVVGFTSNVKSASADCSITSTLRVGSTGTQVVCLQTALGGLTADGVFGPLTRAAVISWQAKEGLVADGIFGPKSNAVWMANQGNVGAFPAGCQSASGFSSTTGLLCYAAPANTFAPTGCTSAAGYSPVTGGACYAVSAGPTGFTPAGCTSASGYSPVTGGACQATNLPAGCTSTAGFSPTTGASCATGAVNNNNTGPLAGTAGAIDDVNRLSQYSGEEVGDGQNGVKVMGFEVVASNDGDIALNSMKVRFVITNTDGSNRLEDYVDSISILQGSTKVGTANAADFNRESAGVYTKVVALSNSVVRADATEKFYITVDAQSNLDSGDIDSETVTISTDNIRYTDGGGVTTTDTTTGDIDAAGAVVAFVTFSASSDTELKIALNNTPAAGSIQVDADNNTDDVVLLKGKFTVTGTSDVWMDTLPIQLTAAVADATSSIAAITGVVTLTLGSNTYTETINATNCVAEADFTTLQDCTLYANIVAGILFDNLDYTIKAGTTVNFTVAADINDINNSGAAATDFDEGDSLKAELTVAARGLAAFVVENGEGDQLTNNTEITGSALGEAQTFYANGVNVTMGTVTYESVADGSNTEQVTYNIPLTVTAFGDTRYIGLAAEEAVDSTLTDGVSLAYNLQLSSAPTSDIAIANTTTTQTWTCNAAIEGGTAYRLDEGVPVSCTLQVVVTTATGVPGSFRVHLEAIQTNTLAALTTGATELIQSLLPVENFETGYKFLTQ